MTLCNCNYSQNTSTITITNEQLQTANIIFAEHYKFSQQIPLLNKQIENLKLLNVSWQKTDSIRKIQLNDCNRVIKDQNKTIDDLNKSLKIKNNTVKYTGLASVLLLVCLAIK